MRSTYRIVAVFVAAMTALALGGCGGQQPESSEMSGQEQPAESSAVDTETPSTSEGDGDAAAEPEAATVGSSLDAYSWAELSEISNEIAAAPDQAVANMACALQMALLTVLKRSPSRWPMEPKRRSR